MEFPQITPEVHAITGRMWHAVMTKLLPAAEGARNQMLDAGMKHGAEPLSAALFEFEAMRGELNEELRKIIGGPR
jgi:uroporphyrinogen-III synthase